MKKLGFGHYWHKPRLLFSSQARKLKRRHDNEQLDEKKEEPSIRKILAASHFSEYDQDIFYNIYCTFLDRSLLSINEQIYLYQLAGQLPENASVLEIGSFIGHSTCLLATPLRGAKAKVYAVDAFDTQISPHCWEQNVYEGLLAKNKHVLKTQKGHFDFHVQQFQLEKCVIPIVSKSAEALSLLPIKEEAIDLLFIDGGHDFEIVQKDIQLYLPLVKSGGVLCFHDFASSNWPGVTKAVLEAIPSQGFSEFLKLTDNLLALRK